MLVVNKYEAKWYKCTVTPKTVVKTSQITIGGGITNTVISMPNITKTTRKTIWLSSIYSYKIHTIKTGKWILKWASNKAKSLLTQNNWNDMRADTNYLNLNDWWQKIIKTKWLQTQNNKKTKWLQTQNNKKTEMTPDTNWIKQNDCWHKFIKTKWLLTQIN